MQWAAQFAVAAELTRRGYSVAFFLGNEPTHDALVHGSSSGSEFAVQVKGFQNRPRKAEAAGTAIPLGKLDRGDSSDIFTLVYVPQSPEAFEFFVATRHELQGVRNSGGPPTGGFTAHYVYYRDIVSFRNSWDKLPLT